MLICGDLFVSKKGVNLTVRNSFHLIYVLIK